MFVLFLHANQRSAHKSSELCIILSWFQSFCPSAYFIFVVILFVFSMRIASFISKLHMNCELTPLSS